MKRAAKILNEESYKPSLIPQALKVIASQLDGEKHLNGKLSIERDSKVASRVDLMTLVQLPASDWRGL